MGGKTQRKIQILGMQQACQLNNASSTKLMIQCLLESKNYEVTFYMYHRPITNYQSCQLFMIFRKRIEVA